MKVKINKFKRKGSMLVGLVIALVIVGILSYGLFSATSNMINLSNKQKENLYIQNTLSSEVNYYSSLKIDKIENKSYNIENDLGTINVEVKIIYKTDNHIELEIIVKNKEISKSQTLKLIK